MRVSNKIVFETRFLSQRCVWKRTFATKSCLKTRMCDKTVFENTHVWWPRGWFADNADNADNTDNTDNTDCTIQNSWSCDPWNSATLFYHWNSATVFHDDSTVFHVDRTVFSVIRWQDGRFFSVIRWQDGFFLCHPMTGLLFALSFHDSVAQCLLSSDDSADGSKAKLQR